MYAAMLSDAHIRGLDDPNQHQLVEWLDQLDASRLFLLGDIFGFWWGFPDAGGRTLRKRFISVNPQVISPK